MPIGTSTWPTRGRVIRALEIWRLTGETPSQRASSAEAEDVRRYVPEIEFIAVGVDPGDSLEKRVEMRLEEMRSGGLVEEVTGLRQRLGRTARQRCRLRRSARRPRRAVHVRRSVRAGGRATRGSWHAEQRTWFQRDPRIRWIPWLDDVAGRVDRVLEAMS